MSNWSYMYNIWLIDWYEYRASLLYHSRIGWREARGVPPGPEQPFPSRPTLAPYSCSSTCSSNGRRTAPAWAKADRLRERPSPKQLSSPKSNLAKSPKPGGSNKSDGRRPYDEQSTTWPVTRIEDSFWSGSTVKKQSVYIHSSLDYTTAKSQSAFLLLPVAVILLDRGI